MRARNTAELSTEERRLSTVTTEHELSTDGGSYPPYPHDDDDEESVETTGETVENSLESPELLEASRAPAREDSVTEAEFRATMGQVELLARTLSSLDPDALPRLLHAIERAEALGPIMDPTAWVRGQTKLTMLRAHAAALRTARREIIRAGVACGELPEGTR